MLKKIWQIHSYANHTLAATLSAGYVLSVLALELQTPDNFLGTTTTATTPQDVSLWCTNDKDKCNTDNPSGLKLLAVLDAMSYDFLDYFNDAEIAAAKKDGKLGREYDIEIVQKKKNGLIAKGWPASALLMTAVKDTEGNERYILSVNTDKGTLVLDNTRRAIPLWHQTPYTFIKVQNPKSPQDWLYTITTKPQGPTPTAAQLASDARSALRTQFAFDNREVVRHAYNGLCIREPEQCETGSPPIIPVVIDMDRNAMETLDAVNRDWNKRIEYTSDITHYGREEYWAFPKDNKGDCEDYAIAKKFSLRKKHWPASALLLTTVIDRPSRQGHALLAIQTRKGTLTLDNDTQTNRIMYWSDNQDKYQYESTQDPRKMDAWRWTGLENGSGERNRIALPRP